MSLQLAIVNTNCKQNNINDQHPMDSGFDAHSQIITKIQIKIYKRVIVMTDKTTIWKILALVPVNATFSPFTQLDVQSRTIETTTQIPS